MVRGAILPGATASAFDLENIVPDCQRTAKSSLATVWMMCFLFKALLSALLQLARIQTDSVVEMLRELYPDVHFEIGELFGCCPGVDGSRGLSLCARLACRVLSRGGFDPCLSKSAV